MASHDGSQVLPACRRIRGWYRGFQFKVFQPHQLVIGLLSLPMGLLPQGPLILCRAVPTARQNCPTEKPIETRWSKPPDDENSRCAIWVKNSHAPSRTLQAFQPAQARDCHSREGQQKFNAKVEAYQPVLSSPPKPCANNSLLLTTTTDFYKPLTVHFAARRHQAVVV